MVKSCKFVTYKNSDSIAGKVIYYNQEQKFTAENLIYIYIGILYGCYIKCLIWILVSMIL